MARIEVEVVASILCKETGQPCKLSTDKILHEIKDNPVVHDACWMSVDKGVLKAKGFAQLVDEASAAINAVIVKRGITDKDEKRKLLNTFQVRHAFPELIFFGAWRMYRLNNPELARRSLDAAITWGGTHEMSENHAYLLKLLETPDVQVPALQLDVDMRIRVAQNHPTTQEDVMNWL